MFSTRILADSVNPDGVRLTTFEATFPRFILAEVNTHRMLSRNSASSRAIPTEKQIERVREHPFVPLTFNERVKGMGVGEVHEDQERCRMIWLSARNRAVEAADGLNQIGVDKSRVNRLLEPFMWHTAIISATEWDNFFGLRDHEAAQPEFRMIAGMMREAMAASEPMQFATIDAWHLPLVTEWERENILSWEKLKLMSASRCARVSFDKHTESEEIEATLERARRLMTSVPAHLSPFEHVARPSDASPLFCGNFRGWIQMRKEIANESNALKMIEEANR